MSNFSKKPEYYVPFIQELLFVGFLTVFCMVFVKYLTFSTFQHTSNATVIEYTQSPNNIK